MDTCLSKPVDKKAVRDIIRRNGLRIKMALKVCVHCSMCAESCFLFTNRNEPEFIPSHKLINSLGYIYKKNGDVTMQDLEEIKDIAWNKCVLCTRCYCPLGVDIPGMIGIVRKICRSQGIYPDHTERGEYD
ncbi:MAG: 4Fe-4S dicluster domain-containing protein [Desulfobacteraceae bacterium]